MSTREGAAVRALLYTVRLREGRGRLPTKPTIHCLGDGTIAAAILCGKYSHALFAVAQAAAVDVKLAALIL